MVLSQRACLFAPSCLFASCRYSSAVKGSCPSPIMVFLPSLVAITITSGRSLSGCVSSMRKSSSCTIVIVGHPKVSKYSPLDHAIFSNPLRDVTLTIPICRLPTSFRTIPSRTSLAFEQFAAFLANALIGRQIPFCKSPQQTSASISAKTVLTKQVDNPSHSKIGEQLVTLSHIDTIPGALLWIAKAWLPEVPHILSTCGQGIL